ncbi:imidazoleglycerol-phosphate dehydratase [Fistulifera solaris]|uniref:Imidazoleglycerol-phosphate dehydratase n=1 Tax=Fistulifera solaris TaxID=1519565 RepID=A0A1Z5JRI6_FISSO|nr:imidazoleglycerol-phosphate dehydratase [Fistulifera solaris]|eukprot:GAX16368.1 imidazoleglycerol-phosphate dehydratase [Fistulifera solaris]
MTNIPLLTVHSISCHDLQKPAGPLQTGIGFLDHMLDQINSHAQMGISLVLEGDFHNKNRHASHDPVKFLSLVGKTVGTALLPYVTNHKQQQQQQQQQQPVVVVITSFSCPLDEALVECQLSCVAPEQAGCEYIHFTPLGKYSRTHLGQLNVAQLDVFWEALAQAAQLKLVFTKVRGDNAHHIIESSFKAFSRALRNSIDATDLYTAESRNAQASIALQRQASLQRSTKETSIAVELQLDGGRPAGSQISTGLPTLDRFWTRVADAAQLTLNIAATGDLWIDEHHTAEDVAIAVGQCFDQALGSKAGLNRMWSCSTSDDLLQVIMDLSNRPCLVHNLHWETEFVDPAGDLSCEMMEHVLESWVVNARWTVHIVQNNPTSSRRRAVTVDDLAMALGTAVRYCCSVDVRRAGATASSKGTLSV